jgi:hypothetical protein
VAGGSNGGVNGVNAIEGGGEVKRGIKEVELGGAGSGGIHLSAGREERAKTARLEVLPREEGGNRIRCHRRPGWLGRPRG